MTKVSIGQMPLLGFDIPSYSAPLTRYEPYQPESNISSRGPLRTILETLAKCESAASGDHHLRFGEAPTARAFIDAATFAKSTNLNATPLPDIYLASDGEINFLWKNVGVHIDLGFYGNGRFSYYAEGSGTAPLYGDDLGVAGGMPVQLLELFRS